MKKLLVGLLAGLLVASPLAVASAAPQAPAKKTAVVIGIGEYQGATKSLPGSAGDAAIIREALLRNGWQDANIKMLVNEAATAANIRDAMRWLVDQSADDSFSVFAYSGHVKQQEGDQDGDGEGNDEFIWPHDNAFISDGELAASLRALRGDAWISMAGCESAGFDDGVSSPGGSSPGRPRRSRRATSGPTGASRSTTASWSTRGSSRARATSTATVPCRSKRRSTTRPGSPRR